MIHPTAVVDASAELADGVHVGAFALIEAGVRVGARCRIGDHAVLRRGVEMGDDCVIESFAVIGGQPQMRGVGTVQGRVHIGDRCVVREGATVNQPSKAGAATSVGADCYLMANSHVGHDCRVGDGVTLANNVMLAGHVVVGNKSFLGGGAGVHQFVRIGELAMVGGNASLSYDVPPFAMAAERNEIRGLNFVGLRRQSMRSDVIADIKRAYHSVYDGPGDFRRRATHALEEGRCGQLEAGRAFLEFFVGGERGFARPRHC